MKSTNYEARRCNFLHPLFTSVSLVPDDHLSTLLVDTLTTQYYGYVSNF